MIDKLAIARLREFIADETGCEAQEGWSCGTCFMAYLDKLGLDPDQKEYDEHNKKIERHNEVWRAILQIRENDEMYRRKRKVIDDYGKRKVKK